MLFEVLGELRYFVEEEPGDVLSVFDLGFM